MQNEIKYNFSFSEYKQFVEFVKTTYNFDFSAYTFCITKRRIETFFAQYNVTNINEIITFIKKEKFWHLLLNYIQIKTTELFRDYEVWQRLKEKHIPKINYISVLNIWMPDVTKDDELFSLIILLNELKITNYRITVSSPFSFTEEKLDNYKISEKKHTTSKLNYSKYNPDGDFEKYFTFNSIAYFFNKNLYHNIFFKQFALYKDEVNNKEFDIILFRNKLLYYSNEQKTLILNKLYTSLKPKGILNIGIKETLNNWKLKDKFTTNDKELKIFIKKR